MKNNIVLIGMPGCGKSTIGEVIAKKLNLTFYDMDVYIEKIAGKTIPELFEKGEDVFRAWETKACVELSKKNNLIIASGGGVVKKDINIDILKKQCIILYIDRPVEEIVKDVNVSTRPLLKDGTSKVYELFDERHELYRNAADITVVNNGLIEEVIESCVARIRELFR
ncbi:MAG: shikimate kinase [Clostridium sp.]|uniref:shikimate kinase n=1 Tax=Clostridium sp. DSM 8431 TaxID=1761781 RepID=UPI0008EB1592|nr:shikimate kinase [Clostridium sp. DSM 8431]MCR4944908.1 shikimate kinase [Clostridium sp.]SFU81689.1 shikimate kinase [Clostridium sp. DSM 8431]